MSALGDILSVISNLSVVFASLIAIIGVESWRERYEQQKVIDLGQSVLVLVYQYIDILNAIRSPWFTYSSSEYALSEGETDQMRNKRVQMNEVEKRLNVARGVVNKINAKKYECKIVIGEESVSKLDSLVGLFYDIEDAVESFYFDYNDEYFKDKSERVDDLYNSAKEIRKIFIGRKNDEFGEKIESTGNSVCLFFGKSIEFQEGVAGRFRRKINNSLRWLT